MQSPTRKQLNRHIATLEAEWDRLDSIGTGHTRQMEIQLELKKLRKQLEHWNKLYAVVEALID